MSRADMCLTGLWGESVSIQTCNTYRHTWKFILHFTDIMMCSHNLKVIIKYEIFFIVNFMQLIKSQKMFR